MKKMQALLQPAPLIPVSNRHIFIHRHRYAEYFNVTNKGRDSITDRLLSALLNLQSH